MAEFLGLHIKRDDKDNSNRLVQDGLAKRVVEVLQLQKISLENAASVAAQVKNDNDDPSQGSFNNACVIDILQYLQGLSSDLT